MPFPEQPEDIGSYYEQLTFLRDEALVCSQFYGRRRQIGRIVFGYAAAEWNTESGGIAVLTDHGIRISGSPILQQWPTKLQIFETYKVGLMLTQFDMELDEAGIIRVSHSIVTSPFMDAIRSSLPNPNSRLHDIDLPTREDYGLIRQELERGALGEYALYK
jgi:hypothetical protein